MTWQEERESLLQGALKRWLVVCSHFHAKTVIRRQIDWAPDEQKLTLLADVFRGRAPATLLKRVRAVEKLCHHFGPGGFPASEQSVYDFFNLERGLGAPPSRLKGFMEAINFCHHVLSMDELACVISSRRCMGTTTADVPAIISQAEPLKVDELRILHAKLIHGEPWDKVFSGAILFATYARSRWADLMHVDNIVVDRDEETVVRFLEGHTSTHKTMRSSAFKHRFLPLTAPCIGVTSECWASIWLDSRAQLGLGLPPKHVVMPAPDSSGGPCARPLSSNEASQWLRQVLTGTKDVVKERKVSIHSCKATCLSFCAKYGLDPLTRLQLGYHTGGDSGLRMVHTYSRDALAEPLSKLMQVLSDIRNLKFRPDCTRSGRFTTSSETSASAPTRPMSVDDKVVEVGGMGPAELVDLVSEKEEDANTSAEDASSSSDDSSAEDFQEERKQERIFLPPVPPDGFIFWQHSKLKTLHLAPPDHRRVFLCNRMIGQFHVNSNMSIRYDTPVCRVCLNASKRQEACWILGV